MAKPSRRAGPSVGGPRLVLGTRRDTGALVELQGDLMLAHKLWVGITGSGKSKGTASQGLQVINQGYACIDIDPHSDHQQDLLLALHAAGFYQDARAFKRVRYFSFCGERNRYPAFDVLRQAGQSPQQIASWVWNALTRAWSGLAGGAAPSMQQVMLSSLVVLVENQRPLTDLHRLLTESDYRACLLPQVRDEQVQQFFAWFESVGRRGGLLSESALRRAYNLSFALPLRYSLGATANDLDLRACMDAGISVFCDLGGLDEESQRLLGCLLTAQAESAALSRADTPEQARRPAFLFVDEWASFAAQSEVAMERMLAQCRKFKLSVTLSCQHLGQARGLQAALQNCVPVLLRLGAEDSFWGAARVGTYEPTKVKTTASGHPTFVSRSEQERAWADVLERLPPRHGVVRLGEESIPFYTLGLPPVRDAERIVERLKARYSELLLHPAPASSAPPNSAPLYSAPPSQPAQPTRQAGNGAPPQIATALPSPAQPPVRRIIPWPEQQRRHAGHEPPGN